MRKQCEWMFTIAQYLATGLAVAGVLLNNAMDRRCFLLWVVSNGLCIMLHCRTRLWGLAFRDVIFTVLAVIGWCAWGACGR